MPPVLMSRVSARIAREFTFTVARTFERTRRLPRWSDCGAGMGADGSRGTGEGQSPNCKASVSYADDSPIESRLGLVQSGTPFRESRDGRALPRYCIVRRWA